MTRKEGGKTHYGKEKEKKTMNESHTHIHGAVFVDPHHLQHTGSAKKQTAKTSLGWTMSFFVSFPLVSLFSSLPCSVRVPLSSLLNMGCSLQGRFFIIHPLDALTQFISHTNRSTQRGDKAEGREKKMVFVFLVLLLPAYR